MRFWTEQQVEQCKKEYPPGTRVELIYMDYSQAPPVGTKGTVWRVSDNGTIFIKWDDGSMLHALLNVDRLKKI